jgi:hypothetical protein
MERGDRRCTELGRSGVRRTAGIAIFVCVIGGVIFDITIFGFEESPFSIVEVLKTTDQE